MKKLLLLSTALLLSSLVQADSKLDEYQKWRQQELTSFQNYLDENDKAFIGFLKQQWKPVEVKPAEVRDPKPKAVKPTEGAGSKTRPCPRYPSRSAVTRG